MQNPPAYVQVGNSGSFRSGGESDLNMSNIFSHHPHLNQSAASPSSSVDSRVAAHPLHNRYATTGINKSTSALNGIIMPGLPAFPPAHHHQRPSFDSPGPMHHHAGSAASLNEAFVNSFGLTTGFLGSYFDRARTPSPLHRLVQSQLLGGHSGASVHQNDNHFMHDDLLLESGSTFRGLNLSTTFTPPQFDRHGGMSQHHHQHADSLLDEAHLSSRSLGESSGHLNRSCSLDDIPVAMLDNSNDDSVDLSLPQRNSSPDADAELAQSEHHVSSSISSQRTSFHHNKSSSTKQRRVNRNGRTDISRTCPTCGKTFGNSSGLAKHRLTHSDERKYLCNVCMKSFKRQDHLSGHLLTHQDKKPFACPVGDCGKSYCDSRSLKRHIDQHEPWLIPAEFRSMFNDSQGDEPEEQGESHDPQRYFNRNNLKPFVCQVCFRRFKNGPALNGHMRLHGGFVTNSKKSEELYSSAPPSVQSMKMDGSSQNASDFSMNDLNSPHNTNTPGPPSWTTSCETADGGGLSPTLSSLNHVPVIRHVSPVNQLHPMLPPVSTLASPTNSPTTLNAPFGFFGGGAPVSPTPQSNQQSMFNPLANSTATLGVPQPSGKVRRHSDSDNIVPPKRQKTVMDRLRYSIIAKHGMGVPQNELGFPLLRGDPTEDVFHEDVGIDESKFDLTFPYERFDQGQLSDKPEFNHSFSHPLDDNSALFLKSPDSVESSGSGSTAEFIDNNPLESPQPFRLKRKHRPGPLTIPPPSISPEPEPDEQMNDGGASKSNMDLLSPATNPRSALLSPGRYSSRLRSPVPRDGFAFWKNQTGTPPPYTPPPMLSPNRSGTGLFYSLSQCSTPHSAAARLSLRRSLSSSVKEETDCRESPFHFPPPNSDAPVTDMTPHINQGDCYQAELPPCRDIRYAQNDTSPEDLMWKPLAKSDFDMRTLIELVDAGNTPRNGRNTELAHHVYFATGGDLRQSIAAMLNRERLASILPAQHPIRNYPYQESTMWNPHEMTAFTAAILQHEKDFHLVSCDVTSKTTKQCVEFYFIWKKRHFPEEYRRMKATIRERRKRQEAINTRSRAAAAEQQVFDKEPASRTRQEQAVETGKSRDNNGPYLCTMPNCGSAFATKQALSAHSRIHLPRGNNRVPVTIDMCPPPAPKPVSQQADSNSSSKRPETSHSAHHVEHADPEINEYPCRLCGKVFTGIKSRNAHMKVHRAPMSEHHNSAVTNLAGI